MAEHFRVITHEACPPGSAFVTGGHSAVRIDFTGDTPIEQVLGRGLMPEPHLTVRTVPVLDTGIGRAAGYRDEARVDALPAETRRLLEAVEAAEAAAFLGTQ